MAGVVAVNPLISSVKADPSLQVTLHPLPILSISSEVTRALVRNQGGAVIGALLGQQNGREITVEFSFPCKHTLADDGVSLDLEWFNTRLEQMKLTHKGTELVGWYSLCHRNGPVHDHLRVHNQILTFNESAVLLGFHLEQMLSPDSDEPIPVTIYESNYEPDDAGKDDQTEGEDKKMNDSEEALKMVLKFRVLPYTTDAGEAERIALDYVHGGSANASSSEVPQNKTAAQGGQTDGESSGKGKRRAFSMKKDEQQDPELPALAVDDKKRPLALDADPRDKYLSKEDKEKFAALTAKANAIRQLKSRLELIIKYLESLPPEYPEGKATSAEAAEIAKASDGRHSIANPKILRMISALETNYIIACSKAEEDGLKRELLRESSDVLLVGVMKDLLESVSEAREAGKRFGVVESAKAQRFRAQQGYGGTSASSVFMESTGDLF